MVEFTTIESALKKILGEKDEHDVFDFNYGEGRYKIVYISGTKNRITFEYEIDVPVANDLDEFDIVEFFVSKLNDTFNSFFAKNTGNEDYDLGFYNDFQPIVDPISRNEVDFYTNSGDDNTIAFVINFD